MTRGSSRPRNPVAERALETDALRLDLTDGLTRTEVGTPDGEADVIIGHHGREAAPRRHPRPSGWHDDPP